MFGSTTPLAERPDWHPVHRANAMLRSALLNEAASFTKPGFTQPFDAIAGPDDGPIGIACPQSLVARLNALDIGLQGSAGIRVPLSFAAQPVLDDASDLALPARDEPSPTEAATGAVVDEEDDGEDVEIEPIDLATQAHMLALVREFQRRQRQANLLVAGSLAAAVLLTLGGFVLIAHLAAAEPAKSDRPDPVRSSSIAWQRPDREAMTAPNRAAKSEALLIPAKCDDQCVSTFRGSLARASDPGKRKVASSRSRRSLGSAMPATSCCAGFRRRPSFRPGSAREAARG